MESGKVPNISLDSINMMLVSIKASMEHLEDEVSDMAEMLESSLVNTSKVMT